MSVLLIQRLSGLLLHSLLVFYTISAKSALAALYLWSGHWVQHSDTDLSRVYKWITYARVSNVLTPVIKSY